MTNIGNGQVSDRQQLQVPNNRLAHIVSFFAAEIDDRTAVEAALAKVHLSHDDIACADQRIPRDAEVKFIQIACDILNDNNFAIRAGLGFRNISTITSYIAKHSGNLREAIEYSSKFYPLVDPASSYALKTSSNAASFEVTHTDTQISQGQSQREYIVFAALSLMRKVTNTDFMPLEIRFQHNRHEGTGDIQRLVGCPVYFGAETNEIILALSTLELPIPTYDRTLQALLINHAEHLHKTQPQPKPVLRSRIEKLLLDNQPGRMPTAKEAAASLGMSRRSFARKLKEAGVSFREISDAVREDLAKTYLNGGIPISEIAFLLDYSDHAGFSTAFKRWTGKTPKSYRLEKE